MSTSIAFERRWAVDATANPARETLISRKAPRGWGTRPLHTIVGLLDDAVLLLLVVGLFPVAILLFGTPVVLLVRLLIEIAQRM